MASVLWPTRCAACGAPGPSPCAACVAWCRAAPGGAGPPVPGLDASRALLAYEGPARRLVTGLKYRNDRAALAWLAAGLAALIDPPPGTVVTWAPTSARRRRRRGFDQAQLLAAAVARRWGVPCRALLARPGHGPPQTGAGAAERRRGPTLVARRPVRRPVVLVDDVVTTGATLAAGARALRAAGAPWVAGVVAARTPRRAPHVDESLKSATEPVEYRW